MSRARRRSKGGYSRLRYEVSSGVGTLTLNRPHLQNAMDLGMVDEMIEALGRIDGDDEVRVAIVTGAGRGFCSGIEMNMTGKGLAVHGIDSDEFVDLGARISLAALGCRKPMIAAVNGAAVGLGASITLPMDIRIASSAARFGFVYARRGVVPEGCSSWFLPRLVGMPTALDWMITGRLVPAHEACRAGLVSAVAAPEDLVPEAHRLARAISEQTSALAVSATRRMLWRCATVDSPQFAARLESRLGRVFGVSPDASEGAAAFFARRQPRFSSTVADLDGLPWEE